MKQDMKLKDIHVIIALITRTILEYVLKSHSCHQKIRKIIEKIEGLNKSLFKKSTFPSSN